MLETEGNELVGSICQVLSEKNKCKWLNGVLESRRQGKVKLRMNNEEIKRQIKEWDGKGT